MRGEITDSLEMRLYRPTDSQPFDGFGPKFYTDRQTVNLLTDLAQNFIRTYRHRSIIDVGIRDTNYYLSKPKGLGDTIFTSMRLYSPTDHQLFDGIGPNFDTDLHS
ncbi:hypothetical protein AVEN_149391-1 [Araneus ventricosus]|uniref:Uncharacterized protein n=1 Tax=Araneus ventricosus TaxID=182803 RepID=A0A4Y2SIM8_ARAVE|nr:hypothetical protein AVEN_149391-1 [Araneus ventricosus]